QWVEGSNFAVIPVSSSRRVGGINTRSQPASCRAFIRARTSARPLLASVSSGSAGGGGGGGSMIAGSATGPGAAARTLTSAWPGLSHSTNATIPSTISAPNTAINTPTTLLEPVDAVVTV